MGKLQPNFSWQKYQDDDGDSKKQFEYQLQQMHVVTANSVNSTVDDISYWLKERPTGETWVNGKQIYTLTVTGTIVGTAITPYALNTIVTQLIDISGVFQDAEPMAIQGNPLPFVNTAGNNVGVWIDPTQLFVDAIDATWDGYVFYVTIKYLK